MAAVRMNREPVFVDNRNGNTLAGALVNTLKEHDSGQEYPGLPIEELRIATAFFSPAGFFHIADHLDGISDVRLLLGADPSALPVPDHKRLDESLDKRDQRRITSAWKTQLDVLERERDQLPFTPVSRKALEALTGALRRGNMQVRRYVRTFLHAKAYIHSSKLDGGIIAGSSNLTKAGLTQNLELNLGCFDPVILHQAQEWFDDLWEDAEPYDLAEIYEVVFEPRSPWMIFLRVLWQLYGNEIEEEIREDENLPLTTFQKHGVVRALRLMRERGGVIVADEVGLGKTFIAGEILQLYSDRRQRALLICPAALRDSTWKQFMTDYQLSRGIECMSFEQLAGDRQLQDQNRPKADQIHLQRDLDEYQLVIVDEAHNYRNPNTPTRAAALRTLLFGKKRDLLLLTATPVNNSLWDLYHLINFFVRQDAHLADRGILSIRQRFMEAMRTDPTNLSPDLLYPIIDATTVKRTRQFVKKHYSSDTIKGPDGVPRSIVFPKPQAITVRYELEDQLPGFFDQLEEALDSDRAQSITFARYMPDAYRKENMDPQETGRAHAMTGLLRSGLLKRFESSCFAFRKTVQKMVDEHDKFLEALDKGSVVTTVFLQEISGTDDDIFEELLEQTSEQSDAGDYDVEWLKNAVVHDRDLLQQLAESAGSIAKENDTKLRALSDVLCDIATQAEHEASDAVDEAQKRKVLIFSFFADTVGWIYDFLKQEIDHRPELSRYQNRLAAVSGSQKHGGVTKDEAVYGFAPVSMGASSGSDTDEYQILVTTDILAEGVNLQQCRHIINYDVPWNPMRLVQRHGRIDRINSPHRRVFLRTIFPTDRLDQLLNLEQRILGKLALAAASVGVVAPLEEGAHGDQVFTETRREIELLLKQDASLFERGSTVAAAQTGEEYRQTLRRAYKDLGGEITKLPWKIGSGMRKGKQRGLFFCAVVGHETKHERTYLRFISANSDWQPAGGQDAVIHELGTCLRMIECEEDTPIWQPEGFHERVYDFWDMAQSNILNHWMLETDPANLQPKVERINREVAAFIRDHPPQEESPGNVKDALDILESPWPRREQISLRKLFKEGQEQPDVQELTSRLVEYILGTGLKPSQIPLPLPVIEKEDIQLLCWMAIECGDGKQV